MTNITLHPTPDYGTIFKEQIRAVGLALRKEGMIFLVFLGFIIIIGVSFALHPHPGPLVRVSSSLSSSLTSGATVHTQPRLSAEVNNLWSLVLLPVGLVGFLLPFGLAGFLIPFGVWRSEDPSRRSYHWALPVARGPHTLIKTLSGWLWLMLAVAIYVLSVAGFIALIMHIAGAKNNMGFQLQLNWQWLTPFTATTIIYLCTSIAVIGSTLPWRWIGGVVACYMIGLSCFAAAHQHELVTLLGNVVTGRYGLWSALSGGMLSGTTNMMGWLKAVTPWIAGSGIGVCIAAFRHGNTHAA